MTSREDDNQRNDKPPARDAEIVHDAEVVPASPRRLADDSGGRVFNADGRLERHERPRPRPGRVHVEGEANVGCAAPVFRWIGRFLGVLAVIALAFGFLWAGGFTLEGAVSWAREHGPLAKVGVLAFVTLMLPLLLPTGPVAIVPGYLWGQWQGLGLVLAGAVLGGVLNMFLARSLLGRRVDSWIAATPGMAALKRVIDARGFRIALALRMSPVTPYALVSYAAGLTTLSYAKYALASVIGGVPWTLVYATAGALLAEQQRAVSLDADVGPAGPWLRLVGLAFTVLVAVWIGRAARRELAAARKEMP